MIKLIASDMDGTLLNDKKEFPHDFDEVLNRLHEKNVHFVVASGRSYSTLKLNFEGKLDKLDFICDNGAYIVINGKLASMSILDKKYVKRIIEICRGMKRVIPVLCGVNGIYFEKNDSEFYDEVTRFYLNYNCVEDISAVDDDIFKIAICDYNLGKMSPASKAAGSIYCSVGVQAPTEHRLAAPTLATLNDGASPLLNGTEANSYPIITSEFKDELSIAVTGPRWIDIMNKGINKGAALKSIREKLNISREETMAFGDYFNDAEMVADAGFGFVMENAHPEMKKYGKYTAESNNNEGVTKAIKKYVLSEN